MKLSQIQNLFTGTIISVLDGALTDKLFEFGVVPGAKLTLIRKAPFNGPVYIKVENNLIALRRSEADSILVQ